MLDFINALAGIADHVRPLLYDGQHHRSLWVTVDPTIHASSEEN